MNKPYNLAAALLLCLGSSSLFASKFEVELGYQDSEVETTPETFGVSATYFLRDLAVGSDLPLTEGVFGQRIGTLKAEFSSADKTGSPLSTDNEGVALSLAHRKENSPHVLSIGYGRIEREDRRQWAFSGLPVVRDSDIPSQPVRFITNPGEFRFVTPVDIGEISDEVLRRFLEASSGESRIDSETDAFSVGYERYIDDLWTVGLAGTYSERTEEQFDLPPFQVAIPSELKKKEARIHSKRLWRLKGDRWASAIASLAYSESEFTATPSGVRPPVFIPIGGGDDPVIIERPRASIDPIRNVFDSWLFSLGGSYFPNRYTRLGLTLEHEDQTDATIAGIAINRFFGEYFFIEGSLRVAFLDVPAGLPIDDQVTDWSLFIGRRF